MSKYPREQKKTKEDRELLLLLVAWPAGKISFKRCTAEKGSLRLRFVFPFEQQAAANEEVMERKKKGKPGRMKVKHVNTPNF